MKKILTPFGKSFASAAAFAVCMQASIAHGAALDISQSPLMLVDSVSPNLIFTIDDSRSMWRASVPDSDVNNPRHKRIGKSSSYNPLYYNPAITYVAPRRINASGEITNYNTSFTSAWHNGYQPSKGSANLSKNYKVTWYCNHNQVSNCTYGSNSIGGQLARNPKSDFPDKEESGVHAYYYTLKTGCPEKSVNEDCYQKQDVPPSQYENFAIWYSFYRDRALATISAAHLAFFDLPSGIRFTWQGLEGCTTLNSTKCENNKFRKYTSSHKANFYTWLGNMQLVNGTPLRGALARAGDFLKTSDAWAFEPNPIGSDTKTKPEYSCRPSFHIMMTDGVWNGDPNISTLASSDEKSFLLPDGKGYSGKIRPFADSTTKTLADSAMHYWATDLFPLENKVKPYLPFKGSNPDATYWDPRNNPATWQSMSNFMVGLGLSHALRQDGISWGGSTFEGSGYNSLLTKTNWPAASADNVNNVYDLWHAALNSRGEFFNADNPSDLIKTFENIINRIAERTSTAAAAGSTTSVSVDDPDDPYNLSIVSRAFFPEYDSEDWSGDIKRYDITRTSNGHTQRELVWSAKSLLSSAAGRNIKMADSNATNGLQDFAYAKLDKDTKKAFDTDPDSSSSKADNKGSDRVDYLKGSRRDEGTSSKHFRMRSSVLGDIINSTPAVVGAPSYIPYIADKIDGNSGKYLEFLNKYKNRPELVYVGANDGMLHAFSAEDGKEIFAFVPSAVLKNMPKLSGQSYKGGAHRFFVDGSPVVRDVYFNDDWHTILIGTLGAGGRSIFALDITNPGENGSGVKLLWEITDASEDYENLGYSFPEPEIVRLHSGKWALLQGNGYNSEDDLASLLIIDIEDGSLIRELIVENGEQGANGLSSVRGADNNGDGIVDYAYAGDLQGNLWRFDLIKTINDDIPDPFSKNVQTSVTAQNYSVSYGGSPLYSASYPTGDEEIRTQAITSPPSLVRHPTRRGYIVIFGTGKYIETDDAAPDTSKANSIYGIWDRLTKAQLTGSTSAGTLTRDDLQRQTIEEHKVTSFSGAGQTAISRTVRYISNNPVKWYVDNTKPEEEASRTKVNKWGWFVDLEVGKSKKGELMTERMVARGDTLLFGTLTPNEDPCADGAGYWAYAINAHTGARTVHPTFDFNQDGSFDQKDTDNGKTPSGYETQSPISLTRDGSVIDIGGTVGFTTDPDLQGRQSWQTMPLDLEP